MGKLSGLPNRRRLEREKTTQGEGRGAGTREGRGQRALREGAGKMEGREEASEPCEAEADSGAGRGEGRCKSAHSETTGRAAEEPQGVTCRSRLFASVSFRPLWHRCLQTSGNGKRIWMAREGAGARAGLAQGGAETERLGRTRGWRAPSYLAGPGSLQTSRGGSTIPQSLGFRTSPASTWAGGRGAAAPS